MRLKRWVIVAILLSLLCEVAQAGSLQSLPGTPETYTVTRSASEVAEGQDFAKFQQVDLIEATLKNDTGPEGVLNKGYNEDGITSDPRIAGKLVYRKRVHKLKARFHGNEFFADITSIVQANGDFLLDMAELERIQGGPLEDGPYALHLEAEDQNGTTLGSTDIAFTLDTTPPQPVLYDPWNGGVTNLQLGFIDVALLDSSKIEPTMIGPEDFIIRNGNTMLRAISAKATSDGLFRYYYEGRLSQGSVKVTFVGKQISDIAGNVNAQQIESFEFTSFRPTFNGMPQRPRRLQIEPNINPPHNEDSGASVYLHSGEAFLRRTDLEIPGRGFNWRFERTYRSGWFNYETPLGHNWDFSHNRRLIIVVSGLSTDPGHITMPECKSIYYGFHDCKVSDVVRLDGQGRADLYRRDMTKPGSPFESPPGFYTKLTREDEEGTRFTERDRHGNVITYDERLNADGVMYPMTSFTDRNGNTMQFQYNDSGQLQFVFDTLGRTIEYFYEGNYLTKVRDFFGREILFDYDANEDLVAVTGPRVEDTPHGNDFPGGKTEQYTYSSSSHPYLRHNLVTVTAPNEVARGGMPREVYVYNDDDRVIEHTYGGTNNNGVPAGGKFTYSYLYVSVPQRTSGRPRVFVDFKSPTTIVTDRNGNRTTYEFNSLGNYNLIREFTNRDVRASDPYSYYTRHQYDDDGQRLTVTYHEGNSIESTFDFDNPDRFQQGNLLQERRRPDSDRSGDQTEIVTTRSYEPIYNQLQKVTEARGYTTTYTFDYQEGSDFAGLAAEMGMTAAEVETLLENAGIPMGLGDVNGDGRTDQIAGNVIRKEYPTVNLLPGSNQAKIEGDTMQEIVELFVYDDFGQLIQETDPEGNVTTYEYYSEQDPDGDGTMNGNPLGDPHTGGYLRQITRDAISDPGRNSGTNPRPTSIRTLYKYDPVGNMIRRIDGRGIATDYVVNELNQVVQIVRAADYVPVTGEVVIDFGLALDGVLRSFSQRGFDFVPKSPATNVELSTLAGHRGLMLVANSDRNAISISRIDRSSFTLKELEITHLAGKYGEWTITSSTGGSQVLAQSGRAYFSGPEWSDILQIEIFQTGNRGDILISQLTLDVNQQLEFDPWEPSPSENFRYMERFWYDFNDNVVLHQEEDRGNTSKVDGSPPNLLDLPIDVELLMIDFEVGTDGITSSYLENGFAFTPRPPTPGNVVQLLTESGNRGLRLLANSNREGVRVRRADGAPFTVGSFTITHLGGIDDEWVVESSAGGRQVLPHPGPLGFSGPEWTDIFEFEIFPTKGPGSILIDDFRMVVNPDPVGGGRAFVDVVYKYDILDNRIETIQEVENGASPHFLRTLNRYDPNGNLALTILPEGNASRAIYDERDLLFRTTRGALTPGNQLESGTSSGGSTLTTLRDGTKSWTENEWSGGTVWITDGTGKGQARTIVSNTDTVLTVSPRWDNIAPDATSAYEISLTLLGPGDPTDYDVRGGVPCVCTTYGYDGNGNVKETVDAADTDLSPDNNNPDLGPGDRTRYVCDGFDRLVSAIDSVGNQIVYQYDPAGNRVRRLHFGPTGGPSPTSDGPDVLPGPVSIGGVIQSANLVNSNLLSGTEYLYDELNRQIQTDQVLFVNTIPTVRTPNVADGATELGKENLTPGDNQAIPGVSGITIKGRVSTRTEFDRKSRVTFTVEDDGDTSRTFYDGVDRVIKTVDAEGNTIESAYDDNHNLIERRQIDLSQEVAGGGGTLQSGQSTGSNGVRTLNDTSRSWRPFEWAGRTLQITGGAGAGQVRKIIDNTSDQLTVDEDWDVTPATSTYAILPISLLDSGQSTGFNTVVTLNDATKTWAVDAWAGRTVEITGGTGAGQVRMIAGSNPFQLIVDPAWDVIPDASSRYAIYLRSQPGVAEVFLTTYFYDSLDRLERQSDNLGQTMYYRYDSRDNLVARADAQGPAGGTISRRAFSDGPLTVNAINDFGNVTLYYYDGINRQTRQETVLTASGSGDGVHIGVSIEGIKNDASVSESFAPTADMTQGGGDGIIRIGTTYDDNSLISARIDDQGNVTLYLYDNLDRRVAETKGLTTDTDPLTKAVILGSRRIVMPTALTINSPLVIATDKINAQLADARERLDTVVPLFPSLADQVDDTPPTTVVHGYDPDSNLLIVEDENDSEVFTRYDAINRPIALRVFRAGQADNHEVDPIFAPNPVSDPSNPSTDFPSVVGTTKQNYQYDGLSRLVLATDDNDPLDDSDDSAVTYAFDSLHRVIEECQQIGALEPKAISTAWRAGNLRSTLTYPNGRAIGYTYDGLDRINTIADDGAADSLVDYNYIGMYRVLERLYPINDTRVTHLDDGGTSDIGYDGLRRQTRLRHLRSDNSLVVGFAHTYDRMNNKLGEDKLHDPTNNEIYDYDYDSAFRAIGFDRPDAAAISPQHNTWDLDGAGNWTSVDGGTETREHSSFNEITTRDVGGTLVALAYDDNGNLTDDGTNTFEWDFGNRLRTVTRKSDGQIIAGYTYDAVGRRIGKAVTNSGALDGTIFYYYDGPRVIEERGGAGVLTQQYVYGRYIDEVLVIDRNLDADNSAIGLGDQRLFYHQNNLMSVYALSDTAATIVEGYLYDGYGRQTVYQPGANGVVDFGGDDTITVSGVSSLGNPYVFTGRRLDAETGLLYYRTRYFDTELGRFISRDAIGFWGDMGNLGNGYTYVGNNPLNRIDPLGLDEPGEDDDEIEKCRQHPNCEVIEIEGCYPGYQMIEGECWMELEETGWVVDILGPVIVWEVASWEMTPVDIKLAEMEATQKEMKRRLAALEAERALMQAKKTLAAMLQAKEDSSLLWDALGCAVSSMTAAAACGLAGAEAGLNPGADFACWLGGGGASVACGSFLDQLW